MPGAKAGAPCRPGRLTAQQETIVALATPPGRGGIAVVRLSGLRVPDIARTVLGSVPQPRRATLSVARDRHGEVLDQGIALYFPEPSSYTGEHVLEFQGHGGQVVMQAVLAAFLDAGARIAEAGEYTRRAFLNGRLDLAQAEAVADLIDAASRAAARSALRSLSGEFSGAVQALAAGLSELRVRTEAMLDFPEEEVDSLQQADAGVRLAGVRGGLASLLARSRQGSLLREGIRVVIAGLPNVGKSSLLNRLAGDERAIVTPVPGTTRDLLREHIVIDGVPLHVVDTAGLRETVDEAERIGVARARSEAALADLLLVVLDATHPVAPAELPSGIPQLRVLNKIDLVGAPAAEGDEILVSAKTGEGLDELRRALLAAAGWEGGGESLFLARERHLRALTSAAERLQAAAQALPHWELFAEELRLAQESLGRITGEFSSDDLLGEIFARFCIGK